jgi:hypothetical protein
MWLHGVINTARPNNNIINITAKLSIVFGTILEIYSDMRWKSPIRNNNPTITIIMLDSRANISMNSFFISTLRGMLA